MYVYHTYVNLGNECHETWRNVLPSHQVAQPFLITIMHSREAVGSKIFHIFIDTFYPTITLDRYIKNMRLNICFVQKE